MCGTAMGAKTGTNKQIQHGCYSRLRDEAIPGEGGRLAQWPANVKWGR